MWRLLAIPSLFLFVILNSTLQGADNTNPSGDEVSQFELPVISLLHKSEKYRLKDLPTPFVLKYTPIIRDSETLAVDGETLVRGIDYQIDYREGTITLRRDFAEDALIEITYQALPFAIKKQYKRDLFLQEGPREKVGIGADRDALSPRETLDRPATTPSQLHVTGSQRFGISVGNRRSLSQNQELRISVDGKVSENVSVIASLSDQDLPIQASGTTENIQDIDQKLIRVTSPNVTATLGDFEGSLGDSEFIFFPRALEGVQVEGDFKWGKFHLIPSSIPKGQSTSKVIRGEEGRSEYRIDADGEFVVVKAGSEIVWLNGEQMRRGKNNDYVIREYGDPTIEFTNKHLITSNDVIRVDFEFIPEDRAYQRNLYGASGLFNLPGDRVTVGVAYAAESDLNNLENAFIVISEQDLADLRRNELDPDGDGKSLIPPEKHSVWGLDGTLNLSNQTSVTGEIAFSALDKNTFSESDSKVVSRAWKLLALSSYEKIRLNLDVRSLDTDFVPVGASSTNRSRFQYEERYKEERFDELYLQEARAPQQSPDERSLDFDLQFKPFTWLGLDSGLGRTEERFPTTASGSTGTEDSGENDSESMPGTPGNEITIRDNLNWAVDFSPKKIPRLKWNVRRSASKIKGTDQFRKERQQWSLVHRLRSFNLSAATEQLESLDLDYADGANLNRRRNISTGRMDVVNFKWASLNSLYSIEESFGKEDLLTLDGETLAFSDWKLQTTARTWTVGFFSQPRKWANLTSNISRRVFEARHKLNTDSTTQLADISARLTPFNRALYGEITYELDKKLATERREIYTNINPFTGREIKPGEGFYVKIDDLHYREDSEEGNYIKIIQNVDDKPVSAIDTKLRLRFRPRQIFSRRRRDGRFSTSRLGVLPTDSKLPPADGSTGLGKNSPERTTALEWLAEAISGEIRFDIREEQEEADTASLYLLRDLRNERTLFGQERQRYQLKFSPSTKLNLNLNYSRSQTLNRRVNNRERWRSSRDWDIGLTLNPTRRISFVGRWEQRREREQFSQLGNEAGTSDRISDLVQFERRREIDFRYELNRALRLSMTGGFETTSDLEKLADEPEAHTRTFSIQNRMIYSLIGKGRIDFNYRLGFGESTGGIPFTRYYFHEGLSHEIRANAEYKVRKVTDLLLRLKYRLLSTKQKEPEHRLEMEVVMEL